MNIFIEEIGTTPGSTASQMFIDNRPFCFIIEDGYREEKVPGETRIPPGKYYLVKRFYGRFYEEYQKKFGHSFAIEIKGVQNFQDVLIHIGNTPGDTRGCPLVALGLEMNQATGDYNGTKSTAAYRRFWAMVNAAWERGEIVELEISRREIVTEYG